VVNYSYRNGKKMTDEIKAIKILKILPKFWRVKNK